MFVSTSKFDPNLIVDLLVASSLWSWAAIGGGLFSRTWHCSSPPWLVIWLGPSCHLCAAVARPSLAGYRLEPPPLPPRRPRTGSRHAAIVYPRRLNAFVSPDAKTTHSFRAPAPPQPAAAASRGAAHRPTRSRPSHYTFTTLPLRRPLQTEPGDRQPPLL